LLHFNDFYLLLKLRGLTFPPIDAGGLTDFPPLPNEDISLTCFRVSFAGFALKHLPVCFVFFCSVDLLSTMVSVMSDKPSRLMHHSYSCFDAAVEL